MMSKKKNILLTLGGLFNPSKLANSLAIWDAKKSKVVDSTTYFIYRNTKGALTVLGEWLTGGALRKDASGTWDVPDGFGNSSIYDAGAADFIDSGKRANGNYYWVSQLNPGWNGLNFSGAGLGSGLLEKRIELKVKQISGENNIRLYIGGFKTFLISSLPVDSEGFSILNYSWIDTSYTSVLVVQLLASGTTELDFSKFKIFKQDTNLDIYQKTTSALPSLAADVVTFDGVGDFLKLVVDATNFQNLTTFEYWCIVDVDHVNEITPISFNKNAGNINDRVKFNVDATGKANIISNDNSGINDNVQSSVLSVGKHIIGFICDGVNYSMVIDNVLNTVGSGLTLVSGSNTGNFVGSLVNKALVNIATVGSEQIAAPIYYPNKEQYSLIIKNVKTTTNERDKIFNYINNRFSLGL